MNEKTKSIVIMVLIIILCAAALAIISLIVSKDVATLILQMK